MINLYKVIRMNIKESFDIYFEQENTGKSKVFTGYWI